MWKKHQLYAIDQDINTWNSDNAKQSGRKLRKLTINKDNLVLVEVTTRNVPFAHRV